MAALIWIIVILCLANYVGRCGAEVLNGVCGKNNYQIPGWTAADESRWITERKAEKRKKRKEGWQTVIATLLWLFYVYAIHTWG